MTYQDSRSVPEVVHGIVGNVEDLVSAQLSLAKAELIHVTIEAGRAARYLGAGAALGQLAIATLLIAPLALLATVMPLWKASLVVGGVVGVVAIALLISGGERLKRIRSIPNASHVMQRRAPNG